MVRRLKGDIMDNAERGPIRTDFIEGTVLQRLVMARKPGCHIMGIYSVGMGYDCVCRTINGHIESLNVQLSELDAFAEGEATL